MLSRRGLGRGCRLLLFFASLLLLFGIGTNGQDSPTDKLQITYPAAAVGTDETKCAKNLNKNNGEPKQGSKETCVFWVEYPKGNPLPTFNEKSLKTEEELEKAKAKTREECSTSAPIIIFLIVLCILLLGETGFVVYYIFFRKRGGADGGEQDAGGSSENIGGAEA